MTVKKDEDRIRKSPFWKHFRRVRSQQDAHQVQDQPRQTGNYRPKTKLLLAGGAAVLLLAIGLGFGGKHYITSNTITFQEVYHDGKLIGEVASPEQVKQLIHDKEENMKSTHPGLNMVLTTGDITYKDKSGYKAKPDSEATLRKLDGLFTSHATAVQLRVDGKVVGLVKDQETADAILKRVKTRYEPDVTTAVAEKNKKPEVSALSLTDEQKSTATADPKQQVSLQSVNFVEQVGTKEADVQPEQIADAQSIYMKLVQGSVKPTKYTVQKGDCVGCIAQKFDISPQVIYENNEWIEDDMIRPGDVLDLTVIAPEVTVETVENVTEIETIEPITVYQPNSNMRAGEMKTVREGKSGKKKLVYKLVKRNGYLMSEDLLGEQVLEFTVPAIVMKGTKVLGEGTGAFSWPVSGPKLTSSFGSRWGRQHKGIDMVGNKDIMAADDGVIEFAGTRNGYGNCIIIDHKNGYKTLYGHLSKISVKSGDTVEKGDSIGIMGNTGHSFGTHLHFEIHKNGEVQNPIKYL